MDVAIDPPSSWRPTFLATERFCWAGAEFQEIQAIHRHWRDNAGLASDEQLAVACWRKGKAES